MGGTLVAPGLAEPDAEQGGAGHEHEDRELKATSSGAGRRGVSALRVSAPGRSSRQTAAPKQKALNATSTKPARTMSHSGTTPSSTFLVPTPLASAASPVRTQAA